MKISPISQGTGTPSTDLGNISIGRTSPDRLAAAKAIAAGEPAPQAQTEDPQVERINLRKLKMKTQYSPDRPIDEMLTETPTNVETEQNSSISTPNEQPQEVLEETKPLSPQHAALAKGRRALQNDRAAFEKEKAQWNEQKTTEGSGIPLSRIKTETLSVLKEAGVSYDDLTQAILGNQENPEIAALKAHIKSLEDKVESKFTERDTQAEESALTEMLFEAEDLAKEGEAYQLIRDRNAYDRVLRHVYDAYKKTGRVMQVTEAMDYVEGELLKEAESYYKIPKVQSKFSAPAEPVQQQSKQNTGMKTLTNRDTARPVISKRDRALAAFWNKK